MTGTFARAALPGTWPDAGRRVLAVVGVGEDAERLYTLLVRRGRASVGEPARATGRAANQGAALRAERRAVGRGEQLAAARRAAARLQEQFRTVLADDQMAEVVRGTEEVRRRLVHAGATASRELWVLERPPPHVADGVLAATGTPPPPLLRVLYDAEGFAASGL